MSGKRSRDKGARRERELVHMHKDLGIEAKRVPLSGSCIGFKGDVELELLGGLRCEVKARGNGEGFVTIQRWLGDNDALFLWVDRGKPMAVLPWATWERVLRMLGVQEAPRDDTQTDR